MKERERIKDRKRRREREVRRERCEEIEEDGAERRETERKDEKKE